MTARLLVRGLSCMIFASLLLTIGQASAGSSADKMSAASPMQSERVAVGDEAHDFALESLEGETYRLSELRGEKNAVIIFFRGAW